MWSAFLLLVQLVTAVIIPSTPLYVDSDTYGLVNLQEFEVLPGHPLDPLWTTRYAIHILLEAVGPNYSIKYTGSFDPSLLSNVEMKLLLSQSVKVEHPFKGVPLTEAQEIINVDTFTPLVLAHLKKGIPLQAFVREQASKYGLLQVIYHLENTYNFLSFDEGDIMVEQEDVLPSGFSVYKQFKSEFDAMFTVKMVGDDGHNLMASLQKSPFPKSQILNEALYNEERAKYFWANYVPAQGWHQQLADGDFSIFPLSPHIVAHLIPHASDADVARYIELFAAPDFFYNLKFARLEVENVAHGLTSSARDWEIKAILINAEEMPKCWRAFLVRKLLSIGGQIPFDKLAQSDALPIEVMQGLVNGQVTEVPDDKADLKAKVENLRKLIEELGKEKPDKVFIESCSLLETSQLVPLGLAEKYPDGLFPDNVYLPNLNKLSTEAKYDLLKLAIIKKWPLGPIKNTLISLNVDKERTTKSICDAMLERDWKVEDYNEILTKSCPRCLIPFALKMEEVTIPEKMTDEILLAEYYTLEAQRGKIHEKSMWSNTDSLANNFEKYIPSPKQMDIIAKQSLKRGALPFAQSLLQKNVKAGHESLKSLLVEVTLPSLMSDTQLAQYLPTLCQSTVNCANALYQILYARQVTDETAGKQLLALLKQYGVKGTLLQHQATQAIVTAMTTQIAELDYEGMRMLAKALNGEHLQMLQRALLAAEAKPQSQSGKERLVRKANRKRSREGGEEGTAKRRKKDEGKEEDDE